MEAQLPITTCCGSPDTGLLVSGARAKERLAICRTCERLRPYIQQCGACSCFVYVKVRLQAAQCPLGKW